MCIVLCVQGCAYMRVFTCVLERVWLMCGVCVCVSVCMSGCACASMQHNHFHTTEFSLGTNSAPVGQRNSPIPSELQITELYS
jgi:hypothetical protein